MFIIQTKEKRIDLELQIEDSVPQFALSDARRLKQVVLNLVSNALKFTLTGYISIIVRFDFHLD